MSFKSWSSYYNFSHFVRNQSRYILDEESKQFLQAIKDTCESRVEVLTENFVFWRAQIGHDRIKLMDGEAHIDDIYHAYPESRMRPLPDSASEGRANPKGIPCLYVASDKETAMSEVRPWLGSVISTAQFTNPKELKVIDCSRNHASTLPFYFREPEQKKVIESVWTHIDNAFSNPVTNSDLKSDYAPTQIISEYIKSLGYDGLAFKSSLGPSYNFALFNLDCVVFKQSNLFTVNNVSLSFGSCDDERW
jgi:hypothetical protein